MRCTRDQLESVLDAAAILLEARRNEMLTTGEWDALEGAVQACRDAEGGGRQESFYIDRDGDLVRAVKPRRGAPYKHRCVKSVLERVAHQYEDHPDPITIEGLVEVMGEPMSQIAAATAFLLERGIVERIGKKGSVGRAGAHLDAMTEYHALLEKAPA